MDNITPEMQKVIDDLNSGSVLLDVKNWTHDGTGEGQRILTTEGKQKRILEVEAKSPSHKGKVFIFSDRNKQKEQLYDGYFLVNTSGKVKLCPECGDPHLQYNAMDEIFHCMENHHEFPASKASGLSTGGKTQQSNSGRKGTANRAPAKPKLDPSFVLPQAKDEHPEELKGKSKYEYAQSQFAELMRELGLKAGTKERTEWLKAANDLEIAVEKTKEKREKLESQRDKTLEVIRKLHETIEIINDAEKSKVFYPLLAEQQTELSGILTELEKLPSI